MRRFETWANALFQLLLTAWVGGLWTVGYLVAPVLFAHYESNLAGQIAGHVFAASGIAGLVIGGLLLAFVGWRVKTPWRTLVFWLLMLMVLLTAVQRFGIQPFMESLKADALPLPVMHSPLRDRFAMWHGISSVLYLIQSLLGLSLLLRASFGKPLSVKG
jgi:hypothetical protein